MKVLYISQYFPPEMGAPAARVSELARHWARAGHQVTVLTGFPNHPTGVLAPEYRARFRRLVCKEPYDGACVVRTWLLPLPNRRAHERVLNYSSFCASAALTGSWLPPPDVVIATSPQLLVPLAGWWIAALKRVPLIFEVRDLWPESLEAVGVAGELSFLHRTLHALSAFLYRRADHIVVVTPAFKDYLQAHRGVEAGKISVVENGVETNLFSPDGTPDKQKLGVAGKFVVSYIGTLGNAHGLGTLLAAARRLLATHPHIEFLCVGEGAEKQKVVATANAEGLRNVRFLPQQPREEVPAVIRASDVCLVLLKKSDVFKTVIPTKMLEFMSCARPVVLGVEGQARQVLEAARAGICIEPENATALAGAIVQLAGNDQLRQELGRNGRHYVVQNVSREQTARHYLDVLERVAKPARARSTATS